MAGLAVSVLAALYTDLSGGSASAARARVVAQYVYSSWSGGWAEWGLMRYCTPFAAQEEQKGGSNMGNAYRDKRPHFCKDFLQ